MFPPIAREPTLSSKVSAELEALILDGQLQPGDQLPSLQTLADQFGVSRTVIREALQTLMAKDLLEIRHGSGTVVRRPSAESVAQSMRLLLSVGREELDYRQVIEVRRLLEIEIAGLAAQRRTEEDLAQLQENLAQLPAALHNPAEFALNDVAFHSALAQATHNPLYGILLDSIVDVMLAVRQLAAEVLGARHATVLLHGAIYEQVKAGNREGAREAMAEHLVEAEATMRAALNPDEKNE